MGGPQSELARRVGVSRQAVSLSFRSAEANLRGKHLLRLSEVLGVPVEEPEAARATCTRFDANEGPGKNDYQFSPGP